MKELKVIDARYTEMADRAFAGLKTLSYREGLCASVRGTATGVDAYYRTRPLGYYDMSLFGGALAPRSERV